MPIVRKGDTPAQVAAKNKARLDARMLDELRLVSREDLGGEPEVSEEQAAMNRILGRGPRKARPARRGLLRVSSDTLDRWVIAGIFPRPIRVGRRRLWPWAQVRAWIAKQANDA